MTKVEFDTFRITLMQHYSDMCYNMCQSIRIGKDWKNELFKLYVLGKYIELFIEYNLFLPTEEDTNFFDRTTMKDILQKINIILNTEYEVNFELEV